MAQVQKLLPQIQDLEIRHKKQATLEVSGELLERKAKGNFEITMPRLGKISIGEV